MLPAADEFSSAKLIHSCLNFAVKHQEGDVGGASSNMYYAFLVLFAYTYYYKLAKYCREAALKRYGFPPFQFICLMQNGEMGNGGATKNDLNLVFF